jgi:uncharacterized protein (DUF1015 family)
VPRFEPFAAERYAPTVDLDAATAPPYDVIDPDQRARLAAGHPANAVHVDLPDEADGPGRYELANATLHRLLDEGVLVADPEPGFYTYRMSYVDEQGRPRHTTGVLGALVLSRPGEGGILPHEHTTPKAKTDRLDLLRATAHNLSPIWGLSLAAGLTDAVRPEGPPVASAVDDEGVTHELWRITDRSRIDAIAALVDSSPVVVADGHHRYETSLAYRDERRSAAVGGQGGGGWDLTLTYVVELTEDELAVRAIHRLLVGRRLEPADLGDFFDAEPAGSDGAITDRMVAEGALAFVTAQNTWLLRPRPGAFADDLPDLDSARLAVALESVPGVEVVYQHGVDNVVRAVESGEAAAGVLLRPATVGQIAATAHGGDRMPPKTTFFWPKPRTGFVFRSLEQ